jgi:LemA protein
VVLLYVLLFLVLIIFAYIILVFNGIISLKNGINKAYSNIDVLLKQRNDELPNLISVVKGYAKHEKSLIDSVTKARTQMLSLSNSESNVSKTSKLSNSLSSGLRSIFALAENYPQLKANDSFLALQKRLSELENQIADRREYYNDYVMNYNNRIQSFPDLVFAKIFGFKQSYELFKADDYEKKNVNVNLDV